MVTSDAAPDAVMFSSIKACTIGANIFGLNQARFQNIFKKKNGGSGVFGLSRFKVRKVDKKKIFGDCPANTRGSHAFSVNLRFVFPSGA